MTATAEPEVLNRPGENVKSATYLARVKTVSSHMVDGPGLAPGRYRLAMACAGTGAAVLEVRRNGRTLAKGSVHCTWPPARVDITVDGVTRDVTTWLSFTATGPAAAPARIAWQYARE